MNTKSWVIIHHSAVSRSKNKEQFDAMKRYHIGKGWGNIGYHYVIEPDGTIKKGRKDDEIGAHCKEKMMNWRSIGICLTGNFDIEDPTIEQMESLRILVYELKMKYKIPKKQIVQHHHFAKYKSCPGKNLSIRILQKIASGEWIPEQVSNWAEEAVEWCKFNKIATGWDDPQKSVSKEEMAVMLYRLYKILKNSNKN